MIYRRDPISQATLRPILMLRAPQRLPQYRHSSDALPEIPRPSPLRR